MIMNVFSAENKLFFQQEDTDFSVFLGCGPTGAQVFANSLQSPPARDPFYRLERPRP
jgi:hypothetical protein